VSTAVGSTSISVNGPATQRPDLPDELPTVTNFDDFAREATSTDNITDDELRAVLLAKRKTDTAGDIDSTDTQKQSDNNDERSTNSDRKNTRNSSVARVRLEDEFADRLEAETGRHIFRARQNVTAVDASIKSTTLQKSGEKRARAVSPVSTDVQAKKAKQQQKQLLSFNDEDVR